MISVLVVSTEVPGAPALVADLEAVGIHVLGASDCGSLVRDAVRLAPDLVVCWEPSPQEPLFQALSLLAATDARPVVVFTAEPDVERIERALQAGVQEYVINGYARERLRSVLQGAQVRFRREQGLRHELTDLTRRFEERKLLDRAKGLLMRATQLSEDEAFRLLRTASMQAKVRVGQLSRQLIATAHDAEAVNRAGQLRMLSQRLVKLYVLSMHADHASAAATLLAASIERAEHNLAMLARGLSAPTFGDLLDAVQSTWRELQPALALPAGMARLRALDALAERLLIQAESLTAALEGSGVAAPLHVINVCGRQRMLSQRLAKQALLGVTLSGEEGRAVQAQAKETASAFEQALVFLNGAPLSSPDIRKSLDRAAEEWQRMLAGVARPDDAGGRGALASASESLLEIFDDLTQRYERSMQGLTG
jgi:AmiR/NasT family two-component response regulator